MNTPYDIVIIGGGPAGLTAGIYASRARMKTLLMEKAFCGGQVLITDKVENFPGFPEGISGPDLADTMVKQAARFGLEIKTTEAKGVTLKKGGVFGVRLGESEEIQSLSLIIATGARWNMLGVPGEEEFKGRGVSYCATCDGPLFKGKEVVVVGGGDTALEDALFLAKFARKVTIVHRRDRLRAAKILQERASANDTIRLRFNSVACGIIGENVVKGVRVKDVKTGDEDVLKCDGVFVLIGITPNSNIIKDIVRLDEKGYIVTDCDMMTSKSGIFACGDVIRKVLRQIVTATGEGATAAFSAEQYVARVKGVEYR